MLFLKSIGYALVLMVLLFIVLAMMAWTKGLFLIILFFVALVYLIYKHLSWRERARKGAWKW